MYGLGGRPQQPSQPASTRLAHRRHWNALCRRVFADESSHESSSSSRTSRKCTACECHKAGRRCGGQRASGQQQSSADRPSCRHLCCSCTRNKTAAANTWLQSTGRAHFGQRHGRLSTNARRPALVAAGGSGSGGSHRRCAHAALGSERHVSGGLCACVSGCGCSLLLMDVARIGIDMRDERSGSQGER